MAGGRTILVKSPGALGAYDVWDIARSFCPILGVLYDVVNLFVTTQLRKFARKSVGGSL